jgi:hypothetical protein
LVEERWREEEVGWIWVKGTELAGKERKGWVDRESWREEGVGWKRLEMGEGVGKEVWRLKC